MKVSIFLITLIAVATVFATSPADEDHTATKKTPAGSVSVGASLNPETEEKIDDANSATEGAQDDLGKAADKANQAARSYIAAGKDFVAWPFNAAASGINKAQEQFDQKITQNVKNTRVGKFAGDHKVGTSVAATAVVVGGVPMAYAAWKDRNTKANVVKRQRHAAQVQPAVYAKREVHVDQKVRQA